MQLLAGDTRIRKALGKIGIASFVIVALNVSAAARREIPRRPWHAPDLCRLPRNSVPPTRGSISAGKQIFLARCASCHGVDGGGDGEVARDLAVRPAILFGPQVQEQSDGALWWKITFGNRPMPAFSHRLSMAERWNVTNYLRTMREPRPVQASAKR